jgi:hypothetical protein
MERMERSIAVGAGINFITWPQLGGSRKMGSDENTMATVDAMNKQERLFLSARLLLFDKNKWEVESRD